MSETNGAAQATRQDLADGARRHYQRVSTTAHDWYSLIPKAIDAWEREPDLLAALKRAEQFISNGVEFGYISMPDKDTPDPAHETLPLIRCAIVKAETGEDVVPCKGCGHPIANELLDEPLCDACKE